MAPLPERHISYRLERPPPACLGVHDEMDVEFARHGGLDLVEELAETRRLARKPFTPVAAALGALGPITRRI